MAALPHALASNASFIAHMLSVEPADIGLVPRMHAPLLSDEHIPVSQLFVLAKVFQHPRSSVARQHSNSGGGLNEHENWFFTLENVYFAPLMTLLFLVTSPKRLVRGTLYSVHSDESIVFVTTGLTSTGRGGMFCGYVNEELVTPRYQHGDAAYPSAQKPLTSHAVGMPASAGPADRRSARGTRLIYLRPHARRACS